jgi:serine/threonine protein kinase
MIHALKKKNSSSPRIKMEGSYVFFDPRGFDIINCPPPNMIRNFNYQGDRGSSKECRELFQRNFRDDSLMYSIGCYMQWVFYSLSPYELSVEFPPIHVDRNRWLFQSQSRRVLSGVANTSGDVVQITFLHIPIVLKFARSIVSFPDILHEYIVGIYAINRLRALIPNYMYTYAMYNDYASKGNVIALEWVDGKNLEEYMSSLLVQPYNPPLMESFLQVFIQIVLALEIGQEVCLFTHFDLHAKNIVCRNVERIPFMEFVVLDSLYVLENVENIPTIIDFGHSTVYCKNVKRAAKPNVTFDGFVGKGFAGSFSDHGMFPYYIPGFDLYRLISYLWYALMTRTDVARDKIEPKPFSPESMGYRIRRFFEEILKRIFRLDIANTIRNRQTVKKFFRTKGTESPSIYNSPLSLLTDLEREKGFYLHLLGIGDYPWRKFDNRNGITLYRTPPEQKARLEECFQRRYCSSFLLDDNKALSIYGMTWNEGDIGISPRLLQNFLKKFKDLQPPPLLIKNINAILQIMKDPSWGPMIQMINVIMTRIRKHQAQSIPDDIYRFYQKNKDALHYYYRIHECWMGFISYLTRFFKIPMTKKLK